LPKCRQKSGAKRRFFVPLPDRNNIILEIGSVTAIRIFLTSVRVKLANFKSPKVKALLSKAFTFGL
jgi:hypothetical protein